jgi:hypothetical protein
LLETSKIKRQFLKVTHHGFTGNLVKATLRYFQHYGIKIHEIPLINEFSNPLFLKIYCRSLLDYNTKSPMVGHRGMRSTIEKFYWAVDRDIGKTLGYGKTKKPTWDAAKELASAMARNGCDWLERATAQQIVENIKDSIKSAQQYIDFLKKQIAANPDEFQGRRYSLLDASQQFLKFADIEIKNGNRENAQISLNLALASADATLSVAPAVGWGKDIYEAWTGYSLVSGKKLSRLEHSMAVGGAVSLGVAGLAGATVKTLATSAVVFTKVARAAKTAEEFAEIEKATENILEMAKNAEKAGVSAEIVAEGLRSTQKVLSEGKHVETVAHDGRSMYKLKDLNPGKPDFVSDGVNSTVKNLVKEKGYTNLDLIKDGYAPIGADGRQINLHHIFAYEPGPVIEMEAKAHTKEFKEFHKMIKESFRNNGSSADNFDDFREIWWLNRAKDFPE